jgi:hypothetical protein
MRFADFFGVEGGYSDETLTRLVREREEAEERRRDQIEREARERQARIDAALVVDIPEWRAGRLRVLWDAPVMLRLSADGSEVETSLGARVPVRHARRLFCAWLAALRVPGTAGLGSLTGVRVGEFTVARAYETHIVIGCHSISRAEAESFANAQAWTAECVA